MIQMKLQMDITQTCMDIKNKMKQTQEAQKNPTTQFFAEFSQIQEKLKQQDELIKQQQSTINHLMQEQGLEDKFTMVKRQLLRSENRCVSLLNKLIEQEEQQKQINNKLKSTNDQNEMLRIKIEALQIKNDALSKYLREYEMKIKQYEEEQKDEIVLKNKKPVNDLILCLQCSKNNHPEKRTLSFDQSSLIQKNNNQQQEVQHMKSQSYDIQKDQQLSGICKSQQQVENKRLIEKSKTIFQNTQKQDDIHPRQSRSKTEKFLQKSDNYKYSISIIKDQRIKNLNLKLYKTLTKLQDHKIYQIEESYDSTSIAILNSDSELKIYDSVIYEETQFLSSKNQSITEVIKYSKACNILLQGGQDKVITAYQCDLLQTYHLKVKLHGHNQTIKALQFNKNNDYSKIISGSQDQTIRLWDLNTEKQLYFIRSGSMVNTLDSFNYSDEIISGHNDGSLKIYKDKNLCQKMQLDQSSLTHVSISSDDIYAISSNIDGQEISLIDLRMQKVLNKFSNMNYINANQYNKPTFAFGDQFIVAGSNDGELFVWSIEDFNSQPMILKADKNCTIHCTLYNKQFQSITSSDSGGNINIWRHEF